MKSQAVAFLLGFTLTSVVLLFVPGISKKTSQTGHTGDRKFVGDSTSVTNGHFSSNTAIVVP